jgi:hypothetical protein
LRLSGIRAHDLLEHLMDAPDVLSHQLVRTVGVAFEDNV